MITKDVFLVTKSLLEEPVSLLEARARVVGAVGAVVSITIALLEPKELDAPGVGKVKVAIFVEESLIVPLLRAREVVVT